MFPDFAKMQEQAAQAMKRAEERHAAEVQVMREILAEAQKQTALLKELTKYRAP